MRSRFFRHRSSGRVNAPRAPGPTAHVTLRLATCNDEEALARLAALYDRQLPSGPLLLAEVDGELQAALTLTGARELMEPYRPAAGLVELLAVRAEQLRDQKTAAELADPDPTTRRTPGGWRPVAHPRWTSATESCPPAAGMLCD
jgi:hypothetical protein